MNERIRELLEQATEVHDYWYRGESQHMVNHKMFAELIVKECIDIAYREGDNVAYLALHFGVEE